YRRNASGCRAATSADSEPGLCRKSRKPALAELSRLSALAPEVLRAGQLRPGLDPGDFSFSSSEGNDRTVPERLEEGAGARRLRRVPLGWPPLRSPGICR